MAKPLTTAPRLRLGVIALCVLSISGCERTEAALIEADTQSAVPKTISQQHTAPAVPATQYTKPNAVQMAAQTPRPRQMKTTPFRVKRCMNMGNALEAPVEGEWGYKIRAKDFNIVARAGFDTVRIPIRWSTHASHRAPYTIDPQFMARVQALVIQAQNAGLGVIIDVHHYDALTQNPAREQKRFLAIWAQIATGFTRAPSNVYFEILNEPKDNLVTSKMNPLYAKALATIRRTNPSRKVIIGGYPWNSLESMEEVAWPNDRNIVATFHYYGPHAFTHQGAEWSDPVMPMGVDWGSRADMKELRRSFARAKKFANASGLPIFVGEFGVIDKVPLAQRNHWAKIQRQSMEAHGFSWCAWDFTGAFKSYDMPRERWLPGVLDAYTGR